MGPANIYKKLKQAVTLYNKPFHTLYSLFCISVDVCMYLFIHLFIHSFVQSFVHSFVNLFLFVCLFVCFSFGSHLVS